MEVPEILLFPEKIFEILNFPVTSTYILTLVLGVFLFFIFYFGLKKKIIPNYLQAFLEWALESLFRYINGMTGDRKKTLEIFPLAATLFIFIFLVNIVEIFPGLGVFHFLRSPSSDLNFTLALASVSMAYIHLSAIKKLGFSPHLKKFFNFKNPFLFFVGILEGISEITRLFSLGVRLFGNLFAGEILLIIVSYLFSFLLPLPFLALEIFVCFIQALIFSSLVVIFYGFHTEKSEE